MQGSDSGGTMARRGELVERGQSRRFGIDLSRKKPTANSIVCDLKRSNDQSNQSAPEKDRDRTAVG